MKTALLICLLLSCSLEPEIQVQRVCLELISEEVAYRDGEDVYIYRWREPKTNVEYVEFSKVKLKTNPCNQALISR